MGFNSCILSSVESMKMELENNGIDVFVKRYQKYESIIGESDRMEFLEKTIKEYLEKKKPTE
jgi:uncharacterized protein (UPF0297 family)